MDMDERSLAKALPVLLAAGLIVYGISQLRKRRKPRSFREDPIGALKDRGEMLAGRAQSAGEDAIARLQESLDELRAYLPEVDQRQLKRTQKNVNKRFAEISDQAQALLDEVRSNSSQIFNR
jgi:hypothetical protein